MKTQGSAYRLTILIGEDDRWHHRPLYHEIIARARTHGLAGATVLRGLEGYGVTNRVHTTRILSLADDLPIAIVIVDTESRIRAFLPELEDLIDEGLAILDPVEAIRYSPDSK